MKAARAVADRVPAGGWCLALGGGTTIDTVKVARIISALAPLQGLLAGEVLVDESTSESLPWRIVALPTTIGTASEVSSVAVVCCGGGRILLRGSGLRPEVACLDPMQTQTLPSAAIVSGAVEALFRTVFPYLGFRGARNSGESSVLYPRGACGAVAREGEKTTRGAEPVLPDRRPASGP